MRWRRNFQLPPSPDEERKEAPGSRELAQVTDSRAVFRIGEPIRGRFELRPNWRMTRDARQSRSGRR